MRLSYFFKEHGRSFLIGNLSGFFITSGATYALVKFDYIKINNIAVINSGSGNSQTFNNPRDIHQIFDISSNTNTVYKNKK